MAYCSCPATTLNPLPCLNSLKSSTPVLFNKSHSAPTLFTKFSKKISTNGRLSRNPLLLRCTDTLVSESENESQTEGEGEYNSSEEHSEEPLPGNGQTTAEHETEEGYSSGEEATPGNGQTQTPVRRRRTRYRKMYPGEIKGITEEMRFVAMKLRTDKKNKCGENDKEEKNGDGNGETWQPSMEGFLKYLVDSELVFRTVERVVDESADVSFVYFRKTGLERADSICKDLEWLREQGNEIPEPSSQGSKYAQYLEELAEMSAPLFLAHLYNIYFSHITGGQVIAKQVSEKLLEGRELETCKWKGDAEELLRGVREKLNALGQHWSRDEKSKCLRETSKAFRFLGQIVRLIILL